MKIVHILPDMHTGGAQKLCIDICNELAKNEENEIVLLSVEKLTDQQQIMYQKLGDKVEFISVGKEGKSPFIIFKVAKAIAAIKPDITHTHIRGQLLAALGLILYGKPNIHTIHNVADKELPMSRLRVHKLLYKFFDFTPVSISDQILESAKVFYDNKYPLKIDNGTAKLEPTDKYEETKTFMRGLRKDENTKIFVSMGRLFPVKNQELMIEATENLIAEGFDVQLVILGSLDVVPEYAKKCQDMIKSKENIHLRGEVSNVSDYLLESDFLCFSSTYEGLPIAIIEAMSIGVPTVSTAVGGVPDVVIEGDTGFLSEDLSVASFQASMKRAVLDNSVSKERLLTFFEDRFSIEKCANSYLELYKEKVKS
jgi:glycosyltransferase involved in cell wall biosynthesis